MRVGPRAAVFAPPQRGGGGGNGGGGGGGSGGGVGASRYQNCWFIDERRRQPSIRAGPWPRHVHSDDFLCVFFLLFLFPPPPLYMWLCVCVFVFFSWATDESAQNETLNPPVNGNHWFRFQNKKLCQRSEILPNFLKRLLPGVTYSSSVIFIDSALFLP